MKGMLCIMTMLLAHAAFAQTGDGGKPLTSGEKALLEIDHAWSEAEQKHDAATLNKVLDDNFIAVGSDSKIQNKADFINDIMQMKILSYQITEEVAHSYGQTGIVTCKWRGHWAAEGKESEAFLQIMAVYTKRDGKWYAVGEQMTSFPAQ